MRCNDIYHSHKFGSYKNPASILTYGFGRSTNNFLITVFNCDESFEWGDSELHTVPWNKSSHFSKRWKILMGDKTAWNRKAQLEPTVRFEQLKKKKMHLWSLAKWVCDYYQLATIISAHLIPITPCQSRRSSYICWYFVMNLHLVIMNLNNFAGY